MRIESCGKNNFSIFINNEYVQDIVYSSKEELIMFIKDFIFKVKVKLNMRGFYKIRVYPQEGIGIYLDVDKLDDIDLSNSLDLRVIIMNDDNFYFETEDYDLIRNCNDKRYKDGLFYCVVDNDFDKILEKVEFGRFIYGKEVINLLNNSQIL